MKPELCSNVCVLLLLNHSELHTTQTLDPMPVMAPVSRVEEFQELRVAHAATATRLAETYSQQWMQSQTATTENTADEL